NTVPNALRVVSDQGQNLRINLDTGALIMMDTTLTFAQGDANAGKTPMVVGAAYNNNFAGAKSTTLFDIDLATGSLVTQGVGGGVAPNTPNAGGLFTVGPLGISPAPTGQADIEIFDETQDAVASFNVGGVAQLYSINLQTG